MRIGYRHGGPAGAHAAAPATTDVLERAHGAVHSSRAVGLGTIDIDDNALTDTTAVVQIRLL
jgi:hypothetical protein